MAAFFCCREEPVSQGTAGRNGMIFWLVNFLFCSLGLAKFRNCVYNEKVHKTCTMTKTTEIPLSSENRRLVWAGVRTFLSIFQCPVMNRRSAAYILPDKRLQNLRSAVTWVAPRNNIRNRYSVPWVSDDSWDFLIQVSIILPNVNWNRELLFEGRSLC